MDVERKRPRTISLTHFIGEAEERAYWQKTDSTKHIDWSKAQRVELPNLKPSADKAKAEG